MPGDQPLGRFTEPILLLSLAVTVSLTCYLVWIFANATEAQRKKDEKRRRDEAQKAMGASKSKRKTEQDGGSSAGSNGSSTIGSSGSFGFQPSQNAAAATSSSDSSAPAEKSELMKTYEEWKARKAAGPDAILKQRVKRIPDDGELEKFEEKLRKEKEVEAQRVNAPPPTAATKKTPAPSSKPTPAAVPKPAPIPVPGAPGTPNVAMNSLNTVDFSWTGAKGSGALTYTVECAVVVPPEGEAPSELEWIQVYAGAAKKCSVGSDALPHLARVVARVRAENASGHGPWTEGEQFWRVQPMRPHGFGGYGPGKKYWWTQTLEEIDVYFPIKGEKIKSSVIHHEAYPSRVVLHRNDTGEVLLNGKLHDEVEADECFWELTTDGGEQCVMLNMRKKPPEFAMLGLVAPTQYWPQVLLEHPVIDKDDLKAKLPDDVVVPEGKTVRQKRPYGREAERAGWNPYSIDANADPPMEDLNNMFAQ